MKTVKKNNPSYQHFDKFIFRSPMYPLDKLFSLYDKKMEIPDLIDECDFREALLLASPDLLNEINASNFAKQGKEKVSLSVLKYFIRSCTRCTPYGVFAGCGIGDISNKTQIELDENSRQRTARLDMGLLYGIIDTLATNMDIRQQSFYTLNSSILKLGSAIRYTTVKLLNNRFSHVLSSIERDEYLDLILDIDMKEADQEMFMACLCNTGIDKDDAKEYIDELIESQVLVSELYPAVTGNDPLETLRGKLKRYQGIDDIKHYLGEISDSIKRLNFQSLGADLTAYEFIQQKIEKLLSKTINNKNIFQADLFLGTSTSCINSKIAEMVGQSIMVLNKLTRRQRSVDLENFRNAFYRRYEEKEIPLLEALDIDIGIGFGPRKNINQSLLLKGLNLGNSRENRNRAPIVTDIDEFLMGKYEQYLENPSNCINILDEEIAHLSDSWDDLPETLSVLAETYTESEDNEPNLHIKYITGSTAAALLARFHHISDEIERHINKVTDVEDRINSDHILAEICHLPQPRVGNILLRNHVRKFEIPYLCNSSRPVTEQIAISDIMVSVPYGRYIKLRCKRTGRSILPKLTNSHNYTNDSIPVYHFLCAMQYQNKINSLGFHWGYYLEKKPFLPRVSYKGVVLSPARWKISIEEQKKVPKTDRPDFLETARRLLKSRAIPQFVLIKERDNKLLINTDHEMSLKLLFSKDRSELVLEEFLFAPKGNPVTKNGESYTNETIISYFKKDNHATTKNKRQDHQ